MVGDRHPLVVGQQRVVGPEQLAHRGGMVDAGVEVGVVADGTGQCHLRLGLRQQAQLEERRLVAAVGQRQRQRAAQPAPQRRRGQRINGLQVARGQRRQQFVDAWAPGALRTRQLQVEHLVADGHADAQRLVAAPSGERHRTAGSGPGSRCPARWPIRPSCAMRRRVCGSAVMRHGAAVRQRVVARQRHGLAQHRAVAHVVGQDQHQLGGQHLGLRVAQAALAVDQLAVEVVGIGDVRLAVQRHGGVLQGWAVARRSAARTLAASKRRQRAATCWSGRIR